MVPEGSFQGQEKVQAGPFHPTNKGKPIRNKPPQRPEQGNPELPVSAGADIYIFQSQMLG